MKKFDFGVEILPYQAYSLEDSLKDLASMGFDTVNLWSARPPLAHHISPDDDPKQILALLEKYKMKPSALTIYCLPLEELKRRIEFASELGVDTVIFDCEANYSDFIHTLLPPLLDVAEKKGIKIAVENHLTVKFTDDFEQGGAANAADTWDEGVESLKDIKRLIKDVNHPNLGICLAPPHIWAAGETISEVVNFLVERKKLFFYYIWDVNPQFERARDGMNFGPGNLQLPRPDGTLDHRVLLRTLKQAGYEGPLSLKCHGVSGWSQERITSEIRKSSEYVQWCMDNR
jgi:sugar phosphate isomerase/epimerase